MFPYSRSAAAIKKRKMKKVAEETAPRSFHRRNAMNPINFVRRPDGQNPGRRSSVPPNSNKSNVRPLLIRASPSTNPVTFVSQPTAPDSDDDSSSDVEPFVTHVPFMPYPDLEFWSEIEQTITFHNENQKWSLMEIMGKQQREIEERAMKKIKEKEAEMCKRNAELEAEVEKYTKDNKMLKDKVKNLEKKAASMRASLLAICSASEDSGSSSKGPDHRGSCEGAQVQNL